MRLNSTPWLFFFESRIWEVNWTGTLEDILLDEDELSEALDLNKEEGIIRGDYDINNLKQINKWT